MQTGRDRPAMDSGELAIACMQMSKLRKVDEMCAMPMQEQPQQMCGMKASKSILNADEKTNDGS